MREQTDYQPKGSPLTGRKVLMMLMGFFGVMLLVNVFMAREAIKTFPGLDESHPYDVGIAYNKEIEAAKAQDALGWSVGLSRTLDAAATRVTSAVTDKAGAPVNGLDAVLHFYYPATRKRDQTVAADVVGDGLYSGAAQLARGHWQIEIEFRRNGEPVFRSRNVFDVE